MTPAMASEPYCAEAPSRSTSMARTAVFGMVLRSTAEEPRPTVPLTLTSAALWRRLPLMSTSVWSGPKPRSVAGRTVSVPSARPGRGKLKDGNETDRAWLSSVTPRFCSAEAGTTSTGTAVSSAERLATRVPVITTCSSSSAAGVAACWATAACESAAATKTATMLLRIYNSFRKVRVQTFMRVTGFSPETQPILICRSSMGLCRKATIPVAQRTWAGVKKVGQT